MSSSYRPLMLRRKRSLLVHGCHFLLTMVTLGLWGVVWWWYVNRESIIRAEGLFHRFDNDYWDYLVERDEPPAALHPLRFDLVGEIRFDA